MTEAQLKALIAFIDAKVQAHTVPANMHDRAAVKAAIEGFQPLHDEALQNLREAFGLKG